jgi:hypothetical protein
VHAGGLTYAQEPFNAEYAKINAEIAEIKKNKRLCVIRRILCVKGFLL